ncbi:RNA-binding S4 domain-containing protein [Neorhodopirellula pilleata]|uniref:Ribosome-associated protein n=1 Tax=Neorhodopirellula pilleata TaxID=2714738 RepID=A0A5C6AVV1_9BACT|nr:RNA-binding S4 domain-containing protein [Neorhodopirellula pilleata]TWU03571.1 ribosome-associated protein [Neorhodopirellula pilleata]
MNLPADRPESESSRSESTPPNPEPMIRLDDFMKAAGMVGTGGEAKIRIQAGEVIVNDEVETRRRRQLHTGDEVNWNDQIWLVELTDDDPSS